MKYSILTASILVSGAVLFASCGGSTPDQDAAAKQYEQLTRVPPAPTPVPEVPKTPAAPQAPQAPMAPAQPDAPAAPSAPPAPAPPKAVQHDANLAGNGSFEYKDENGRPGGWIVSPPDLIAKASDDAAQGKELLALDGVKGTWGIVARNLVIPEVSASVPVRVEAWGKAPAADLMSIRLVYKEKGEEKEVGKRLWPDTKGEWTKLEFVTELPESIDADTLQVKILLSDKAGKGYALDNVRVTSDLLRENASLDSVDENGRPVGWLVTPVDIIVPIDGKPYDGAHAIGLKPSKDNWGILGRNIVLDKGSLGHTLTISAWGKAEKSDNLMLTLQGKVDGKDTELSRIAWPASPKEWAQLAQKVELPKSGLDPESVQVRVLVRQGAEGVYALDLVQASLE